MQQSPSSFNWFDIVLVLVLLWSALAGLRAGLARVLVSFSAAICGLIAGFWFYGVVAQELMPWIPNPAIANMLGFLIIFIGALLVGALAASLLSRIFQWFGLSWLNHMLGGIAGFFRGALVISAIMGVLIAYSPSPTPAFLEHSRVLPYVGEISWWLLDLAPRELRDAFMQQMQNLRQMWHAPSSKQTEIV